MNVTTRVNPDSASLDMSAMFDRQRARALLLRGSGAAQRIATLKRLEAAVLAHRADIYAALMADLHKAEAEVDLAELMPVLGEIRHAVRHLRRWMRPRRAAPTLAMLGTQARIRQQPKGVTLIIAPWNYPFGLTLGPLVSAIAAGNTAMVKPSELSPASSAVMGRIIAEVFEPDEVAMFEGGPEVSTALLALPFDHMFFTGSPAIGKIVMAAAAKHLSSVTLELGGKSPVILDASADMAKAARSIAWGKFLNAGQTCIAPDYLFVHESVMPQFLAAARQAISTMFGPDIAANADYGRIINARHAGRIAQLVDGAVADGAQLAAGGARDLAGRFIAPTLLTGVKPESAVMQEEIFGPVLPVVAYSDLDAVIAHINAGPKPLALYVYAKDEAVIEWVLRETSSGGACVNMSLLHFSHANLPFGGVNNSGIGAAHGEFGFRAFSHERAVLRDKFSTIPMLYPPYTKRVAGLIKAVLRYFV
jgi:aldehyde dehydrogenase (NAD+)